MFSYTLGSFMLYNNPILFFIFPVLQRRPRLKELSWFEMVIILQVHAVPCYHGILFGFMHLSGDLSLGTWHFHLLGKSFLFEKTLQKCLSRKSVTFYTLSPMNTSQLIIRWVRLGCQMPCAPPSENKRQLGGPGCSWGDIRKSRHSGIPLQQWQAWV